MFRIHGELVDEAAQQVGLVEVDAQLVGQDSVHNLSTHNGTIGFEAPRFHAFTYQRPPDAQLIVCTDGISSRFSVERYPGLVRCHPSLTAALLYRDFGRRRDDATVVVVRARAPQVATRGDVTPTLR